MGVENLRIKFFVLGVSLFIVSFLELFIFLIFFKMFFWICLVNLKEFDVEELEFKNKDEIFILIWILLLFFLNWLEILFELMECCFFDFGLYVIEIFFILYWRVLE